MRTRTVAPVALAMAAVVSLCCSAAPASDVLAPTSATRTGLAVTGYAEVGRTPAEAITRQAPALREVGIDGVTLSPAGDRIQPVGTGARELLARTHDEGLAGTLVLSNYSSRTHDFSPAIGERLLRSDTHVEAVARTLASDVDSDDFDGVTVDLESLSAADGSGLVRLVTRLQELMPAAKTVAVDVMASPDAAGYRRSGYRTGRLARQADLLVLMAYDQHGPWDPERPGPVGGLPWQRRALAALLTRVDAQQVDLGVAGYGFSWPAPGRHHDVAHAYPPTQMRAKAARNGVTPTWSGSAGEWTAVLRNGTRLWWADRRSYALRVGLARRAGLHGLAVWRIGLADSLV